MEPLASCRTDADLLRALRELPDIEHYAATLECQVRICAESVDQFLSGLALWRNAGSVLDAGCGPGAFAKAHEHGAFAGKAYTGIDVEAGFIEGARRQGCSERFRFVQGDAYNFAQDRYDITLMWAILQHLPYVDNALDHLRTITDHGFVILDTKPGDYGFSATPPIPSLSGYYRELQSVSRARGRNVDCIETAKAWAARNQWKVTAFEEFAVDVDTPQMCDLQFFYALLVSELFRRRFAIPVDLHGLIRDLRTWREAEEPSVSIRGGYWLVLEAR